jgi:hypothetical protein
MPRNCSISWIERRSSRTARNRAYGRAWWFLFAGIWIVLSLGAHEGRAYQASKGRKQPPAASGKRTDPFLQGPPLTLEKLLVLLSDREAMPEARVLDGIRKRGVDFDLRPENLAALKAKGASDNLIELVKTLAKPAPPPPGPAPQRSRRLDIACAPGDCEVSVDGHAYRPTTRGKLSLPEADVVELTLDFRKPGYQTLQKIVKPGVRNESVEVTLEPEDDTKLRFGKQLFSAMLTALGSKKGLAEAEDVKGLGAATSWDVHGALSEWTINVRLAPARLAVFDMRQAQSSLAFACRGETCQLKSSALFKGRQIKDGRAPEIATNLRMLHRYNLAAMVNRINSANVVPKAQSAAAPGAGEQHLRLDAPDESFDVVLNAEMLPISVTYHSRTGLGSGLQVVYADYVKLASSRYPRRTQIKLPDAKQHGLLITLESVEPGAGLKDKDLPK